MTDEKYSILLLARPGYHRNGIEATLLTIDNVHLQTADTCEIADVILSRGMPELFLIYPDTLEINSILDVCDRFFIDEKNRVMLLVQPYHEDINRDQFCDYQVVEIETSGQLKSMIRKKMLKILFVRH
jgi:hypothetical protein